MGNFITAIFGDGVQYITGEKRTGYPSQIMEILQDDLDRYSRGASVEYIGMTSGNDGRSAMSSRYDDYKRSLEINEMRLLYETSSPNHVREVERRLINYRSNSDINKNRTGGGGGDIPEGARRYFVYVAYKR